MTRTMVAVGLAVLLLANARGLAGEESKAGAKLKPADLIGEYTIVSGERAGKEEPAERIRGTTVRFTEDRIVVTTKDKEEVYGSTYTLDAGASPCRITMVSKLAPAEGEVAKGLIAKDGDTVRLIYALPGGAEPTEFKTQAKQLMFVMKPRRQ